MKITREHIRILRRLARLDFSPPDPYAGICKNFSILSNARPSYYCTKEYRKSVISWPHYSGFTSYPVPDPDFPGNPCKAASKYILTQNQWSGKYGELRRDLARHLANEFEKIRKEQLCTSKS